jgi:hypothetical protein
MLKPFTFEGRFECGFNELVKNRVCALTAVTVPNAPGLWGLGLAIANEGGYHAIPMWWTHADSYELMEAHAVALNKELFGLDVREALSIVASTMAAQARSAA